MTAVTNRYVKKSIKEGEWLSPLKYAWNPRAVERRKARRTEGPVRGCLFWQMKAVFLMKDEQAEDLCIRLIEAGGGKIVSRYDSIGSLIERIPLYREVTRVFLDNCQELAESEAFLVNKCEQKRLRIDFLYFKSLYDMIAGREYILTD